MEDFCATLNDFWIEAAINNPNAELGGIYVNADANEYRVCAEINDQFVRNSGGFPPSFDEDSVYRSVSMHARLVNTILNTAGLKGFVDESATPTYRTRFMAVLDARWTNTKHPKPLITWGGRGLAVLDLCDGGTMVRSVQYTISPEDDARRLCDSLFAYMS